MRKVFLTFFIFMIFGCSQLQLQTPVCRHKAIATAILYAENGEKVRIVDYSFYSKSKEMRHAEPQVLVGGNWKYIRMDCQKNEIVNNPEFQPIRKDYYDIHEYLLRLGVKSNF